MVTRKVHRNRELLGMRNALASGLVAALALVLTTAVHAATITVTTLNDPTGPSGTCSLRDAITAANTMTATNGCAAGTGNDTINFSVIGTIALASTLPTINDRNLTIKGLASPGITIDGSNGGYPNSVQVMQVASGATLNLNKLTIANGGSFGSGGG
ncbi:MAG: CSLREA domain-containing protein, partial [Deltaproteobacteria bacterium]|nr:CSLREA domain-containing protein [Deltaproteobacteria bacterium]